MWCCLTLPAVLVLLLTRLSIFFPGRQLANPQQRDILDANYGRKDSACEARCKVVFEELRLRTLYTEYEEDAYVRINMLIEKFPEENYDGPVSGGLFFTWIALFRFSC